MLIQFPGRPACPACGQPLNPDVTYFRDGVAVCEPCRGLADRHWDGIRFSLADPTLAYYLLTVRGLLFWIPRDLQPPGVLRGRVTVYDSCFNRPPPPVAASE